MNEEFIKNAKKRGMGVAVKYYSLTKDENGRNKVDVVREKLVNIIEGNKTNEKKETT